MITNFSTDTKRDFSRQLEFSVVLSCSKLTGAKYRYAGKTNSNILDAVSHFTYLCMDINLYAVMRELNDTDLHKFMILLKEPFLLFADVDNCVFCVSVVRMLLTAVKIFGKSQPVG
jgi:hypothetical protein